MHQSDRLLGASIFARSNGAKSTRDTAARCTSSTPRLHLWPEAQRIRHHQARTATPICDRAGHRSPQGRRAPRPLLSQRSAGDAANAGYNFRRILAWLSAPLPCGDCSSGCDQRALGTSCWFPGDSEPSTRARAIANILRKINNTEAICIPVIVSESITDPMTRADTGAR
jgi:hypothetical protein